MKSVVNFANYNSIFSSFFGTFSMMTNPSITDDIEEYSPPASSARSLLPNKTGVVWV